MKNPTVVVVDDFLDHPDAARELALKQKYRQDGSAGQHSLKQHLDIVTDWHETHKIVYTVANLIAQKPEYKGPLS